MVLYLYPLIVGCLCSLMICIGLIRRTKSLVIFFLILPCFFASPFYTVTRGAAGAITASDITGVFLLFCLLLVPKEWKKPRGLVPVKLMALFIIIMGISIWTIGLYNNYWGVSGVQLDNVRVSHRMFLPVLMAGYRFLKLSTLYSYFAFFTILVFSPEDIDWLVRTIIAGCIVLSIAKALTVFNVVDLSLAYGDMHAGYTGPRILGLTKACAGRLIFMGVILCLAKINEEKAIISIITIFLLTAGLVLTGSRGAIGALFAGLIPICLVGRMRGILIGCSCVAIILLAGFLVVRYDKTISQRMLLSFNPESLTTASERVPIWHKTLSVWLENPSIMLFGVGAFNFAYAKLPVGYETAHNDLLTVGSELGLAAMMVSIAWIISMAILLFRNIRISFYPDKWKNICILAIFTGLVFAGQFEATFYPTISGLPMSRVVLALLFMFGLNQYKNANTKEIMRYA